MTNSTISLTEIVNESGIIDNAYQQHVGIIAKHLYDPENSELTALQLRRLINLELRKNGMPIILVEAVEDENN